MKLLKQIPAFFFLFLVTFSCSKDDTLEATTNIDDPIILEKNNKPNNINKAIYVPNQLIVQYNENLSPAVLDAFRASHGIYKPGLQSPPPPNMIGEYKICDLCDPDAIVELWTLQPEVDIEIVAISMSSDDDSDSEEVAAVSYNLRFQLENDGSPAFGTPAYTDYSSKVVTANTGTTVAIIDTGLNTNFPVFSGQPFLFNASASPDVAGKPEFAGVVSGWDFVNSDNDPFDDNIRQHGSMVTGTYVAEAQANNTDFQIIPLKVSDDVGVATLFNIICAVNAAGNMGAKIVNKSLGYYLPNTSTSSSATTAAFTNNQILINLFRKFDNTLFISSAGNSNNNNDPGQGETHRPSSINEINLLAIGAAKYPKNNPNLTQIADFSNYGIYNVDFVAKGVNVPFQDVAGTTHLINGTSFAAPKVSAFATLITGESSGDPSPYQIINKLNTYHGTYLSILDPNKQIKYNKVIE